jgi:SET domain-containing protein
MDVFVPSDGIEIRRDATKGRGARGVFARRAIADGEVFERSPVLLVPKTQVFGDTKHAQNAARISWYVFAWKVPTKREYVALALGYGSIYNHSFSPNALYRCVAPDAIEFVAIAPIEPGDEITINYNGDPADKTAMAFQLAGADGSQSSGVSPADE